jgi:transposase
LTPWRPSSPTSVSPPGLGVEGHTSQPPRSAALSGVVRLWLLPASQRTPPVSVWPQVNTALMGEALEPFAKWADPEGQKVLVLLVDNAGWHVAKGLPVPGHVRRFGLPSCTPELQPAEHLWPLVREALANRDFDHLVGLAARSRFSALPRLAAAWAKLCPCWVTRCMAWLLNWRVNVRRGLPLADLLTRRLHSFLSAHHAWGSPPRCCREVGNRGRFVEIGDAFINFLYFLAL